MNKGYLTLKICLHRSYSVLRKKECGHQFFKQYKFLIWMVDLLCLFNPFFSRVDETWLVMMTGGDGFTDFGGILNLQMESPVTGTHVGFFRISLKIDSSSLDSNNGCNGSQCTLFPGKNWKYCSWSETESVNSVLFPVKCRVKFQSAVSTDKKCISTQ